MAGQQEYDENMNSLTDQIMRYEDGEMDPQDAVEMFQSLVDSGLAWQLQGHYGRIAQALIDDGIIHA